MNNKVVWVLEYNFHLYTINLEEKEVTPTKEYFDTIEDLLKTYRKKKDALFCGCINYNTDFHIYRGLVEEQNIEQINNLLDM